MKSVDMRSKERWILRVSNVIGDDEPEENEDPRKGNR